jgi:hypothetical protein
MVDSGALPRVMGNSGSRRLRAISRSWSNWWRRMATCSDNAATCSASGASSGPSSPAVSWHSALLTAVTEGAASDDRLRERQVRLIDKLAADLATHIGRAQEVGSACPDLDPQRTAKWLLWTFDRALYELMSPADQAETEKLLDAVTMIIWRTVYAGYRNARD